MTSEPGGARSASAQTFHAWRGVALLGWSFRSFFPGAAVFAAFPMAVLVAFLSGALYPSTASSAVGWRVQEFASGYDRAVVAGFLSTAIPNWSGRVPAVGARLTASHAGPEPMEA